MMIAKFEICFIFWLFLRSGSSDQIEDQEIPNEIGGVRFSCNLYNRLMHYNVMNWCFSPFGVRLALAMLSECAQNDTASQLESVLELNDFRSTAHMHTAFQSCLTSLYTSPHLKVFMATRIYVQNDLLIGEYFNTTINTYYKASAKNIEFYTNPEHAATEINNWIEHEMRSMFMNMIPPGALSADNELVLVNAVFFKGKWKTRFDPSNTKLRSFDPNYGPNRVLQVPTMYVKGNFKYVYSAALKSQVLELPYQGDRLVMHIILPEKGGNLLIELNNKVVNTYTHLLAFQEVEVYLPKFVNSFKTELSDPLKSLGIVDSFSDNAYQFISSGEPRQQLSAMFHQSVVVVDEDGEEEAKKVPQVATTAIEFRVNRPCIFIVCDLKFKHILFMGELLDFKL